MESLETAVFPPFSPSSQPSHTSSAQPRLTRLQRHRRHVSSTSRTSTFRRSSTLHGSPPSPPQASRPLHYKQTVVQFLSLLESVIQNFDPEFVRGRNSDVRLYFLELSHSGMLDARLSTFFANVYLKARFSDDEILESEFRDVVRSVVLMMQQLDSLSA